MKTDRLPQDTERDVVLEASQARGDEQLAQVGRWPLDVPLPATLRDCDLMRVIGKRPTQFYALKARGVFRFLELRPALVSASTLYSGHMVRQWTRGELGHSRYFQAAAKRTADVTPIAGRRPGRPRKGGANQSISVLHDAGSVAPTADERKSNSVAAQGNCGDGR